jgi:hypothetical protein
MHRDTDGRATDVRPTLADVLDDLADAMRVPPAPETAALHLEAMFDASERAGSGHGTLPFPPGRLRMRNAAEHV